MVMGKEKRRKKKGKAKGGGRGYMKEIGLVLLVSGAVLFLLGRMGPSGASPLAHPIGVIKAPRTFANLRRSVHYFTRHRYVVCPGGVQHRAEAKDVGMAYLQAAGTYGS